MEVCARIVAANDVYSQTVSAKCASGTRQHPAASYHNEDELAILLENCVSRKLCRLVGVLMCVEEDQYMVGKRGN
jgi:ferredoxin-like protein FixX